ncbi:MAG: HEAT repeat domain-containing protein [Nitrospira sp.]|nr:HEAT repeat domain-containing protein [Nitrospira sp.]
MEPLAPVPEGNPLAHGRAPVDPEVAAVKQLLKLLDKAAKSARTYGAANPVAQRFFQQFYDDLTTHLTQHTHLALLVQRNHLFLKDQVVYEPERDATGDSFAFKMYSDGIRELSFHQGLTREDLAFFLDALWGIPAGEPGSDQDAEETEEDDDIVTRLWAKNLDTITVVTAEELVRSSGFGADELELQTQGYMNMSVSSLRELLDRERAKKITDKEGTGGCGGSDGNSATGASGMPGVTRTTGTIGTTGTGSGTGASRTRRFHPSVAGYDVSDQEHEALAQEIQRETSRDATTYILDILTAVLASEPSPALLTKLFDVWDHVIDVLIRAGEWTLLETVMTMLQEAETVRPDLADSHKQQVAGLFEGLHRPERLKAIGVHLNRAPQAKTDGLLTLLLMMKPDAVPGLCSVLATLDGPAHQAVILEALETTARDHVESVLRGLTDKRPTYVRNLLALLSRWNDARFADHVEKTLRHPEPVVRREALRILAALRPTGNGTKLVALLADADETVRLTAMKVLAGGQYTAPYSAWVPFLTADDVHDRSPAEKRAIFLALKHTTGDEAVPYWQGLLTEWSWTNRKKKEELALLAADILGKLATPAAVTALELGQKKGGTAVRQACSVALSAANRVHRRQVPSAANS